MLIRAVEGVRSETAGINVQKDTDGDPTVGRVSRTASPVRAILSIVYPNVRERTTSPGLRARAPTTDAPFPFNMAHFLI
jgi:hypothetical protein